MARYQLVFMAFLLGFQSAFLLEIETNVDGITNVASSLLERTRTTLQQNGPAGALLANSLIEEAFSSSSSSLPRHLRLELLEEAAFVRSLLKRPAAALEARLVAWELRGGEAASNEVSRVQFYSEVAQLSHEDSQYQEALAAIKKAWKSLEEPRAETAPLVVGLLRSEANSQECAGNIERALVVFERALVLEHGAHRGETVVPAHRVPHEALLRLYWLARAALEDDSSKPRSQRIIISGEDQQQVVNNNLEQPTHAAPPATSSAALVVSAWESRQKEVLNELLSRGPWRHPQQLPVEFVPGLRQGAPWHSTTQDDETSSSSSSFPHLAPVAALLQAATPALQADLRMIRRKKLLLPEDECIHNQSTGFWGWHTIKALWNVDQDDQGCSAVAPAACALVAQIEALKLDRATVENAGGGDETSIPPSNRVRVLRGSFSVLGPGAHLRPHCGPTNARLKFHLALDTPLNAQTGQPCASMRVGNETRAWQVGDPPLFFDDSFEHEVWNTCTAENSANSHHSSTPRSKPKKGKKREKTAKRRRSAEGRHHDSEGGSRAVFQLVIAHPDLAE